MSATLGGLIKDYRLQKNISQLEIAFAMGWKEPSRLSRIEQGRVGKPQRELVDKLTEAMNLKEEEKNYLLLIGNYLPTTSEIQLVQQKLRPFIDRWKYPVEVLDFSWRIIGENSASKELYQAEKIFGRKMYEQFPHMLELLFNPVFTRAIYLKSSHQSERSAFLLNILTHFQYAQRIRTKEVWYTRLVKKMMNDTFFRTLWKQAQRQKPKEPATNFGKKIFIHTKTKRQLKFYFFVVPLVDDPRFDIEFHMPADVETMRYFKK